MSYTTEDIISVCKENIENHINFSIGQNLLNPFNTNNKVICMSIPVKCSPESSDVYFIIPTYLDINILDGNVNINFDKSSICIYHSDVIGSPVILKENLLNNEKFDIKKFDCCIEKIDLTVENLKNLKYFSNVKFIKDVVTVGSKPKFNSNNSTIPMFINTQLTFPMGGKNGDLFYIMNDTYAIGTKAKWLMSNDVDNFRGSLHVYVTVVTPKIDDSIFMREVYFYIQIKRKYSSCIGDVISCTGNLYKISAKEF